MVEFALVFPLLLVLGVSAADYGYYIEHIDNIDTIVRDGTRFASLNTTGDIPHTVGQAWVPECATPTWSQSTDAWTCAGVSTTVASGWTTEPVSYFTGTQTLSVSSTSGFGTQPTLSVATSSGVAVITCSGVQASPAGFQNCTATSGSGNVVAGAAVQGSSDSVEGVIQQEAESLTVPEGGMSLDNIDCCWASSCTTTTPPSSVGSTSGLTLPTGDASCMSIAYYKSSDGSYSTSSMSLQGWYSAAASSGAGCYIAASTGLCASSSALPQDGWVVQVTVLYDFSQQSPGPVFTVMNSTFHIDSLITAQYSMVVS